MKQKLIRYPNLKYIDLSHNKIPYLPGMLSSNIYLNYLDLSQNNLEIITENIHKFSSLQYLDISENPITEIHDELYKLPKLNKLLMYKLHLVNPVVIPNSIDMPNLQYWDIGYLSHHFSITTMKPTKVILPEQIMKIPKLFDIYVDLKTEFGYSTCSNGLCQIQKMPERFEEYLKLRVKRRKY